MAEILVVGGGLAGQTAAMLLAKDGHSVTVLERDAAPPPASVEEAWAHWERRGVNQFRMLHYFLPRFRDVLERELPEVITSIDAFGALRYNPIMAIPADISGGVRDGDDRFESITGRRPVMEAAVAAIATAAPGVDMRRGVPVRGLLTDGAGDGVPHVTGVVTESGDQLHADLVVDVGGRRSALPRWLSDIRTRPPLEELEDCGFVYYGRHFRSADGSVPPAIGGLLQPYDSVSILTLPADNGTWGLGIIASAHDANLRATRDVDVWERVVRSYPLVAHWIDAEPIDDSIAVMAKIEDRHRAFVVEGEPVVTGVAALGDAWACTNPSLGRGATIGLLHACALRDVLGNHALDDHVGFARAWHDAIQHTVEPLYRDTLAFDRHRLAEIDAQIAGVTYETDDPGWLLGEALAASTAKSPDSLRDFLDIVGLNERGVDVLAKPGVAQRAMELGSDREPPPGPSRAELLAVIGA